MTKFYLPRLKAHALSAAVGSGKTRAAVAYMVRNPHRNFLYVAPTIALGMQTAENIVRELPQPSVRNLHLVNGKQEGLSGKAKAGALISINGVGPGDGQITILTTPNLLSILASIKHPELWTVIMDEVFEPVQFDSFNLGKDVLDGWNYFREVFDVVPEDGHRIVPREDRRTMVGQLADGGTASVGDKYAGMVEVAKAVSNPACRCELLVTPRVSALLAGEPLPKRKKGEEGTGNLLEYATYIDPAYFSGFREVLFMSALFEQSVLFQLWTKALGVTFETHPEFPTELMRDIHGEQGRFLAVGHLLHGDDNSSDNSSKENLFRHRETGQKNETREGHRVLDQIIDTASAYFGKNKFLLQVNKRTGYEVETKQTRAVPIPSEMVPDNATLIPAFSHGMNTWKEFDNVVALCVTNPNPQRLSWIKSRTGMENAEATLALRVPTIYQALGRCSIRQHPPTTDRKTLLVAGRDDAKFLHGLFPGSRFIGQVGDLPSMAVLEGKSSKKEDGKLVALERALRDYLKGIDGGLTKVGTAALKTIMEPVYKVPLSVSEPTWRRALALVTAEGSGSGWRRKGHFLVRVTAADYGFTPV